MKLTSNLLQGMQQRAFLNSKPLGYFPLNVVHKCFTTRFLSSSNEAASRSGVTAGSDKARRSIGIVGTPTNTGQPHSGVEDGPRLLRCNGKLERSLRQLGYDVKDYGDVNADRVEDDTPWLGGESRQKSWYNIPVFNARSNGAINQRTARLVEQIADDGRAVLHLGGDHSVAVGSIVGHARARRHNHGKSGSMSNSSGNLAVLWVDAHADVNLPTSSYSGKLHGMPMGFLLKEVLGYLPQITDVPGYEWLYKNISGESAIGPPLSAHNIAYIGLRAVDPDERIYLEKFGIKYYGMKHIDRYGIYHCVTEALQHINPDGALPLHCSFDIDALDPFHAPSTGTPEVGGLTLREALTLCEVLHESETLAGFDMVEVNAKMGSDVEQQRTLQSAVQLIRAAFGYPRHCLYEEEIKILEKSVLGHRKLSL